MDIKPCDVLQHCVVRSNEALKAGQQGQQEDQKQSQTWSRSLLFDINQTHTADSEFATHHLTNQVIPSLRAPVSDAP